MNSGPEKPPYEDACYDVTDNSYGQKYLERVTMHDRPPGKNRRPNRQDDQQRAEAVSHHRLTTIDRMKTSLATKANSASKGTARSSKASRTNQ